MLLGIWVLSLIALNGALSPAPSLIASIHFHLLLKLSTALSKVFSTAVVHPKIQPLRRPAVAKGPTRS
jgi:hypothetical protein